LNTLDGLLSRMRLLSTPPQVAAASEGSSGSSSLQPPAWPEAVARGSSAVLASSHSLWHIHSGDSPVPISGIELLLAADEGDAAEEELEDLWHAGQQLHQM
jgi:hypothetical protein